MEKVLQGVSAEKEMRTDIRQWIALFVACSIGSGILLLPEKAAGVNLYTVIAAVIFGSVASYLGQSLMIRMTSTVDVNPSYDNSLNVHLGKGFGIFSAGVYIILTLTVVIMLGTAASSNLASGLAYYHVTHGNLVKNPLFVAIFLAVVASPMVISEKMVLRVVEKIVAFKIVIILAVTALFIPLFKVSNLTREISLSTNNIFSGIVTLLPVLIFAISFFAVVGPATAYFKTKYSSDSDETNYERANKSQGVALVFSAVIMIAFIFSAMCVLSPSSLTYAAANNLTALTVVANNVSGTGLSSFLILAGFTITVLAILTSFYGVLAGVINGAMTKLPESASKYRKLVVVAVFAILYTFIVFDVNILNLVIHFLTPLIICYMFVVPGIACFVSKKLRKYGAIIPIISIILGVFLLATCF